MIKLKALKKQTYWIYFLVLFVCLESFLVASVYGVDFSCPGGQWVVIESCSSSGGSCGQWQCEEIIGNIKYVNTYWPGTDPTYPCYSPPPCNTDCPTYCYPPSPYLNCGTLHSSISEWQCPAVCTNGQTQACPYTGPPNTENVGICKAGTQTCVNGQWGACEGEVLPTTEICGDGKDNNCNGQKDETCSGSSTNLICLDSAANAASGNFYHSQTLFQMPNSKLPFDFTLSYNSSDIYNSTLGKGWTHNWNILLFSNPDGAIGLKGADGNVVFFRASNGVYYPDASSGDSSYIIANPDSTFTQTKKDGTTYAFNTSGRLISIKDLNDNTTTLVYSGSDLAGITDSSNRTMSFTLSNGKITAITDPAGNIYTLTFSSDFLTSITNPLGQAWRFTYDTAGLMLTKTDPSGSAITYTYDQNGKVISSTDPEGKTKSITYDPINQTATVTEKDSGIWTYKYDPLLNVPKEKTDPDGNKTTYTYDSNRNLLTETDPLGHLTTYTYDSNRNRTSVTDALGKTTSYAYNSLNKVTSITDQTGSITTFTYDPKGNLLTITEPTGAVTQFAYDSKGNVISMTDPKNQTTTITYDTYNNPITITDATGAVHNFTYDIMGNLLSSPNPQTQYEYNSLNQLIRITDALNSITTFTYDPNGNRKTVTDAEGNTTTYEHNYRGQIAKITDALNNITTLIYGGTGCPSCGGADKLTSLTEAKGNITRFEYDKRGNLKKEIDPLGYATTYTYDGANNLISKTDANGKQITYTYDALNRLIQKTYPDGTTETFTYDPKGNILTAANVSIGYTFAYDAANRITTVTDSTGKAINYEYDANGNRKKMILPGGNTTTYTYDPANRPSQIQIGAGTFVITYDSSGQRISIAYPNGTSTTYTYDGAGRATSLLTKNSSASIIDSYTYTYDKVANRLSMTEPAGPHNYTYDKIYQLKQAMHPAITTENYNYDAVGNRAAQTVDTANRLLEDISFTFTYDNNGNLITKTNKTTGALTQYFWDYENRLKKIIRTDATVVRYIYDPFGRRIKKNINGVVTKYLYDNEDIVLEYDGTGAVAARYTHGPGIDEPLSIVKGGVRYYYHADALGSIKALTNSAGSIIKTYNYKAYGAIASQTGTLIQPYTFTGREYDKETGLYYYNARYYYPSRGRFISKDPIGFGGGDVNLYRYVGNNPVNWVDPEGLFMLWVRPWPIIHRFLRPAPRGIPESEWYKWSEYNVPPEFYPPVKPPIPWYLKPWPFNWKPDPPHIESPHKECDEWT